MAAKNHTEKVDRHPRQENTHITGIDILVDDTKSPHLSLFTSQKKCWVRISSSHILRKINGGKKFCFLKKQRK